MNYLVIWNLHPVIKNGMLYVRNRVEKKKLAEYSGKAEINYYLPLRESERIYDRRKIIFTKPLFPGYVFVKCNFIKT